MKINTFFGFKDGKLQTIILSTKPQRESAIDCDYYISDPQDAEKQIEEWKNDVKSRL